MYGLRFKGEIGEAGKKMTLRGSGDCEWRGSTPGPVAQWYRRHLNGSLGRALGEASSEGNNMCLDIATISVYRHYTVILLIAI